MNRTGKTNARKGAEDYNAYRDFHDREVEAHILAAFMTFAGMHTFYGMCSFEIKNKKRKKERKKIERERFKSTCYMYLE